MRAVLSHVRPTGRMSSAASAAAGFSSRSHRPARARHLGWPGRRGRDGGADGQQLAAITWTRQGMAVGTDNPSLSRIGDALQFAEPFADAAAKAMTAKDRKPIKLAKPDPCAQYGSRMRVEGMAAKFATGLYVPQMSGAKAEAPARP
uniref:Uncharacterized protein n=1 Tax=Phenylobacterium glaciei TaxID=2803784 RepID=A0A974SAS6_9CAUL|nr:hypothetical protein JKL49_07310 [Phenylobacterium glaciei]